MRIGTAGWSISREMSSLLPGEGTHLDRYSAAFNCAEINSSFHRSHRVEVYRRWADQTPANFRFSVKLPRSITHEGGLRRAREPLLRFISEASGLGDRLAVFLVQLPPSFAFEARPAGRFFRLLGELYPGAIVCEPRHPSWFTSEADRMLAACRVTRAAADPPRCPQASRPGGWLGADGDGRKVVVYHRWHGSPRVYWSRYERTWLQARVDDLKRWQVEAECWCIFDNTAGGGALSNAFDLSSMLLDKPASSRDCSASAQGDSPGTSLGELARRSR